tara:strand:+ start:82 stop:822 length:741 start_codon:yes stop_codon:yes gene_type:complete
MDSVQGVLDSILFCERFPPVNNSYNEVASSIHTEFWEDAYNKNLRLDDVEIEFRLGKCPLGKRGPFDTNISEKQFNFIMESLQGYNKWDETTYSEDVIGYFPAIDESIRFMVCSDGTEKLISKQKVTQADYIGKDLPFDFRLAVNLELTIPPSNRYNLHTATRTVTRKRRSFLIGTCRYDLTKVVEQNGKTTHQIEIEIVDLTRLQVYYDNSQHLVQEVQTRLVDLMNSIEPIRAFHVELLRKRHF